MEVRISRSARKHKLSAGRIRQALTNATLVREARAAEVATDILSRTPGRPSLSGASEKSPSLTIRLPKQDRARLEHVAAKQGRRASEVVRDALDDYLTRHAG